MIVICREIILRNGLKTIQLSLLLYKYKILLVAKLIYEYINRYFFY